MNEAFWFVWNENGYAPTHKHPSEDAAIREAERLAKSNKGQRFIVLQSVSAFVVMEVQKIDLRPVFHSQEIPF